MLFLQKLSFEKVFNYIGQRSIFLASRLFSCTIFNISNAPWKIKFYYFEFVLYKKVSIILITTLDITNDLEEQVWYFEFDIMYYITTVVHYYYFFYSDAILTQNSILEKRKCNNAAAD